jgi:outer membrane lipoprotein-sorting protein
MKHVLLIVMMVSLSTISVHKRSAAQDAQAIIQESVRHYRGNASEATIEMVIHRPGWERRMEMVGWTKGTDRSLIRITAPAKDKGNGTLKKGHEMWTYNPKVNRVIKLPPSLMAQAWMGSNFSNNDLAKSDSILFDYTHKLIGSETHDGHTVHIIESTPKPDAPVVWGLQRLKIRDDHVLLVQEYYDEDLELVKRMTAGNIRVMSGRLFPQIWKMQEADTPNQYTLLHYHELLFLEDLPDRIFTTNQLKTQQRR